MMTPHRRFEAEFQPSLIGGEWRSPQSGLSFDDMDADSGDGFLRTGPSGVRGPVAVAISTRDAISAGLLQCTIAGVPI